MCPTRNQNMDQHCWEKLRLGDAKSLTTLYDLYVQDMYNYGFRVCRDENLVWDGIQDVFEQLWLRHKKLHAVTEVKPYLLRCLRNVLIDHLKKQINTVLEADHLLLDIGIAFSPEDILVNDELTDERKNIVFDAMRQLNKKQREILYLRFYHDLSYEEIAKIVDMRAQSVRNLVSKTLKEIRNDLPTTVGLSQVMLYLFLN